MYLGTYPRPAQHPQHWDWLHIEIMCHTMGCQAAFAQGCHLKQHEQKWHSDGAIVRQKREEAYVAAWLDAKGIAYEPNRRVKVGAVYKEVAFIIQTVHGTVHLEIGQLPWISSSWLHVMSVRLQLILVLLSCLQSNVLLLHSWARPHPEFNDVAMNALTLAVTEFAQFPCMHQCHYACSPQLSVCRASLSLCLLPI